MSGVGAMAAGGIGAFAGNMHFGNMAGGVGGMFGNACQQVSNVHLPHFDLKWSCGIEVEGRFTCQGKHTHFACQCVESSLQALSQHSHAGQAANHAAFRAANHAAVQAEHLQHAHEQG